MAFLGFTSERVGMTDYGDVVIFVRGMAANSEMARQHLDPDFLQQALGGSGAVSQTERSTRMPVKSSGRSGGIGIRS